MMFRRSVQRRGRLRALSLAGLALLLGCPDDGDPPAVDAAVDGAARDGSARDSGTDGPACADVDCSALDGPCVVGVCDPGTGACEATPRADGTSCDDGDACTSNEMCAAGACVGEAVDCSAAGDMCNTGACDPTTGTCVPTPVADGTTCDDGSACTTGDMCVAGACAGEAVDCSASSDMCNVGECDPATGTCGAAPMPDGTLCSFDTDSCTIDECAAGACGSARSWCAFVAPTSGLRDSPYRGSISGTLYEDACPDDQVMFGVLVSPPDNWFVGMRAQCGSLELQGDNPFTLHVRWGDETPHRGTVGRGLRLARCPDDHVVVGFGGRSGAYIDQLVLRCAPLTVTLVDGGLDVGLGPAVDIPAVGGTGGRQFPQSDCPAGLVAKEARIRVGSAITGFGLGCTPPLLSGGVTRIFEDCDAGTVFGSPVLDRHAGTACRPGPAGASYVDLAGSTAGITLYGEPGCTGPSLRLTEDTALCGLTYDGTDIDVNDNVGSYRLEY